MKIGFLGSSFDPITNAHLICLDECDNWVGFDQIFLMPSSNKRGDKTPNVSDEHRLAMIELAIQDDPKYAIELIELDVPYYEVHTYQTMRKLRNKYPNDDLYFIMGADLLLDIADGKWNHPKGSDNWGTVETLLSENQFVVIQRNDIDLPKLIATNKILRKYVKHFTIVYKGVDNNISSSYIREEYEIGHNPKRYMPSEVAKYIEKYHLYKKRT